jgi:hypothetical protein
VLDIAAALAIALLYPVFLFIVKNPLGLARNIVMVILARKSWVGYTPLSGNDHPHVPLIKKGVLYPLDALKTKNISEDEKGRLNILYARDYHLVNDLNILLKGFRNLGRR